MSQDKHYQRNFPHSPVQVILQLMPLK